METYIQDYNRVKMAVDKGIEEEEISRIVKFSPKLVEGYLVLLKMYEDRKVNVKNKVKVRKRLGLEWLGAILHYFGKRHYRQKCIICNKFRQDLSTHIRDHRMRLTNDTMTYYIRNKIRKCSIGC